MYRTESTDRGVTVYISDRGYNGYGEHENESKAADIFAISVVIGFVIFLFLI